MKQKAFTLSETLITIAVIGIVAIIIFGNISETVLNNVREKQIIASKHKLAKAVERMALNNDIGPYYGTGEDKTDATDAFVRQLSRYYKINQICTTTNLEDCWGYNLIKFPSGNTYDIRRTTNGRLFKNGGENNLNDDFDVETRGILATDGTRYIVAYNKNCNDVIPQVFEWSNDSTNNEAMNCLSAIMDIDGNKAPNKVGKDISFINATGIGNNCIVEIGDACFGALFIPTGITHEECEEHKNEWGLTYCAGDTNTNLSSYYRKKDILAGIAKMCGKLNNVVTEADMTELFQSVKESGYKYSDFGLPSPSNSYGGIFIIVGEEINDEFMKAFIYRESRSTAISDRQTRSNGAYISGNVFSFCKMED